MAMLVKLALRDVLVLVVCLGAWALDARIGRPSGGAAAWVTAALVSGATALAAFYAHEWGHLAGALLTRSEVHLPKRVATLFLFHFDTARNDRRQFLAMSLGGFVASALVVALVVALAPLDALSGKVALALVGVGVLATLVLEVPTALGVHRGGALPRGVVYEPIQEK
jgi:hypothetical protein